MSKVLRLGLAGLGPWGRHYQQTVGRRDDAAIAASAGRDWEKLVGEEIDGIIIATPPASHLAVARRFGELGVALLIEKPLCLDLAEALAFRDAAAKFRVPLLVDHIHLFSPAYRLLKELSPLLGRITGIVSAGGCSSPARPDTPPLWDWGPHDVSMVLDLMHAEPLHVAGRRIHDRPSGAGREENYEIELEFPGAVRARIAVGNAMSPMRRLEVIHERGSLVYDDLAQLKLAYNPGEHVADPRVADAIHSAGTFRLPLDCVVEEFCAAIRASEPDLRQLDLAISVIGVLNQVGHATQ